MLLDESGTKEYEKRIIQPSISSQSTVLSHIIPEFESSGLPGNMKQSWSNAEIILEKKGITKVQGSTGIFAVISTSKVNKVHIVKHGKSCNDCDCEGFKINKRVLWFRFFLGHPV